MKKINFNCKILIQKKYVLPSEFTRKFSLSNKLQTSTVAFIANRQQAQINYKMEKFHMDPVKYGKYKGKSTHTDPLLSLKTSDEIWNFITNDRKDKQKPEDISRAIRKCSSLNDYEMCWKLFEFAKSKFIIDSNLYQDMFLILLNHGSIYKNETKILQIYYQLMNEINTFNIAPNCQLITKIFTFLTYYQQYNEAHNIWNELKNSKNELLFNLPLWNSYLNTNIKQCLLVREENTIQLTHILKLYDEMYNIYGVKPNDVTFTNIISAIAKLYKKNKKFENNFDKNMKSKINFVEIGEQLFEQCSYICGHDPFDNVYAAMIDLYGTDGNIEKCMQLLNIVIDKQLNKRNDKYYQCLKGNELLQFKQNGWVDTNGWNERTLKSCFGSSLKSIINNQNIDVIKGFELIDYIINDLFIQKCKLKKDVVIYGHLFHCIGAFGKENIDMKKKK
eukprot:3450_1